MFVYQPTFNVLELKNDKGAEYVISWNAKGLCSSKPIASHGAFLRNLKYFGNKTRIQFNSTALATEQNYTARIVNAYIVYDLDNWPEICSKTLH